MPRVLVVRLGSMGDVIHAMPAVAHIRQHFPDAHIGWAIEERWLELLCAGLPACLGERGPGKPLVDAVHVVNTVAWRAAVASDETWKEAMAAVGSMRDARYEVAIDFQGAWKSALLARFSGTPVRFGFRQQRERPASMFYNRQVEAVGAHVIEQNIGLADALVRSFDSQARQPEIVPERRRNWQGPRVAFPRDEAIERWCEEELARRGLRERAYALVNPGAGWGAKQWPAERYGEVACALAVRGILSVVNYGPNEEELAEAVRVHSAGTATPLRCSIAELIALTRRARLFIGGDTGPLHLAAALQVPVVAIFGPTDPARTGPWRVPNRVLRSAESRTSHARVAEPEEGLLSISAADMVAAAEQLMEDAE